jgi:hypothetical protein
MLQALQPAPGDMSSPEEELGLTAEAYLLRRQPGRRPATWVRPGFLREICLVRVHLAPIQTRASLAASFGREAFASAPRTPATDPDARIVSSPVHVAYALRWLELADVTARRPGRVRTEDQMPHRTRESARARRDRLVVRVDDARRRRQIASARAVTRERLDNRNPSTRCAAGPREAVGWFG